MCLHKHHPSLYAALQDLWGHWMENIPQDHHTLHCVPLLCDLLGSVIRQPQGPRAAQEDARLLLQPSPATQLLRQLSQLRHPCPLRQHSLQGDTDQG